MIIWTMIFLFIGVYLGFLSKRNVLRAMQTSGYYNESYRLLLDDVQMMIEDANLLMQTITDQIPENQFYIMGHTYIEDCLDGKKNNVRIEQVKEDIDKGISNYFKKHFITLDAEQEIAKQNLVEAISGSYKEHIEFPVIEMLALWRQKGERLIRVLLIVCITLLLITSVCIYWLKSSYYVAFSQLGYSGIAAGLIILTFTILVWNKMDYSDLSPFFYQTFLKEYFTVGIKTLGFSAAVNEIIAGVFLGIAHRKKQGM